MNEHFPKTAAWLELNGFKWSRTCGGQVVEEEWQSMTRDTVLDFTISRIMTRPTHSPMHIRLGDPPKTHGFPPTSSDNDAVAWLEREFNS